MLKKPCRVEKGITKTENILNIHDEVITIIRYQRKILKAGENREKMFSVCKWTTIKLIMWKVTNVL